LKKKKVLSFFGVFVSGCVFHLISVFLGPEHRWCEDPIGIGPFIIIPSYASVLLFSAQDNSRYSVLSVIFSTHSPGAWAEWRSEACLHLFISGFSISFLKYNSLCLSFTKSSQLTGIHRAKTFRIETKNDSVCCMGKWWWDVVLQNNNCGGDTDVCW